MRSLDIDAINETIHARVRLGIMAALAEVETTDFVTLKQALNVTQGNLSIHLTKLENAGYITIDKRIVERRPVTTARITRAGRSAFADYLAALGSIVAPRG